jgi:hypothetical protein
VGSCLIRMLPRTAFRTPSIYFTIGPKRGFCWIQIPLVLKHDYYCQSVSN